MKFVPLDDIGGIWSGFVIGSAIGYAEYAKYIFLRNLYYYESWGNGLWLGAYRLDEARRYYQDYLNHGLEDKPYYRKVMGI